MSFIDTALRHRGQDDSALLVEDDRRDDSRIKVLKQVRISGLDSTQHAELATVVDLTREGLYFTARSPSSTWERNCAWSSQTPVPSVPAWSSA